MPTIVENILREQQEDFINSLFLPDLTEGIFFFLFNPVKIPDNQDVYQEVDTLISGIFLERPFKIRLQYSLSDSRFTLQVTSENEKRAQEIAAITKAFIDKSLHSLFPGASVRGQPSSTFKHRNKEK